MCRTWGTSSRSIVRIIAGVHAHILGCTHWAPVVMSWIKCLFVRGCFSKPTSQSMLIHFKNLFNIWDLIRFDKFTVVWNEPVTEAGTESRNQSFACLEEHPQTPEMNIWKSSKHWPGQSCELWCLFAVNSQEPSTSSPVTLEWQSFLSSVSYQLVPPTGCCFFLTLRSGVAVHQEKPLFCSYKLATLLLAWCVRSSEGSVLTAGPDDPWRSLQTGAKRILFCSSLRCYYRNCKAGVIRAGIWDCCMSSRPWLHALST